MQAHYKIYKKEDLNFSCDCGKCNNYRGFFHAEPIKNFIKSIEDAENYGISGELYLCQYSNVSTGFKSILTFVKTIN